MALKKSRLLWLLLILHLLAIDLFAQTEILNRQISIQTNEISLKEALRELEQKAGCSFVLSRSLLKNKDKVRLDYTNTPLHSILQDIFGIEKSQLVLKGNKVHILGRPTSNSSILEANQVPKGLQDSSKTPLKELLIDQVVVTGQYRPQSINQSIYRVEVIDKHIIENMAVSNVAELLKQQINIDVENQSGIGRSKIRVLGLNSQYSKILMDNIPIAGDENMGSDVDLSTISMDDVERVEIVRGAMGVEYGANAIAGVINIITKRRANKKTDLSIDITEETVAKEYNMRLYEEAKGRHIQRLNLSHNFSKKLSIGGALSRDHFAGYWGEMDGSTFNQDWKRDRQGNYSSRGYEWSPKTSYNGNAYLSYFTSKFSIFYKANYFQSDLTNHRRMVYEGFLLRDENFKVALGINDYYRNKRYNHHFSARGDIWKNAYFSIDGSYQLNGLRHKRRGINLANNSEINPGNGLPKTTNLVPNDWMEHYQSKGFYSRGTFLKPVLSGKLNINLGYEIDETTADQGYTLAFLDIPLMPPQQHTLTNGGAWLSAEWNVTPRITIRPGFRANFSSVYKVRSNESLTTRLKINEHNDLRLIIGTSTRFPNFHEMYMQFVDPVHEYRGNPNLRPEYGQTAELAWSHQREVGDNMYLQASLSSMFQNIKDRIVNIVYPSEREGVLTGLNTFTNENKYRGLANQIEAKLLSSKFHLKLAGSIVGYRGTDEASENDYQHFLINSQLNAQATYNLPFNFRAALFYRYVGKQPQYVFLPKKLPTGPSLEVTEGYYKILAETDPYHNLDFNLAKSFYNKKLDVRVGIRNIFGVTDITYVMVDPPEHIIDRELNPIRLYYGHTYFLKLSYSL